MEFRKMAPTSLHVAQQRRRTLWDSVGEGEGGMIWENSTETCILPYVKQTTSPSLKREEGYPKLVLWDNPEGCSEERDGTGVQDWGTHVHPWLIHVNVWQKPSQYCKIIILKSKL